MRNYLLTWLFILVGFTLPAQNNAAWTSFWNKDSTLAGFKDKNGVVKIKPKFNGLAIGIKFQDIVAVTEDDNGRWKSYYLTRSGRIVGKDSLYTFDNGPDCENEGFIRFRDHTTHLVGMFDKNGNVAIPAVYNFLTIAKNGLIIARKGAHWEEKKRSEMFEFPWVGGEDVLIDTSNRIIADSFAIEDNLNFYSLLVSSEPHPDSTRQSIKTRGGHYYSFIDFNKAFSAWLKSSLLSHLTKTNLLAVAAKKITYWKESKGWVSEASSSFLNRNFNLVKAKLMGLLSKESDYSVFDDGLNPFIYEGSEYQKYFNNCGQARTWLYPVEDLVISYNNKIEMVQDHFEFLRTDNGYKLISISIKNGRLR